MISKQLAKGVNKLYDNNNSKVLFNYIIGYLLNQMLTKVSIRKLGSKAEEALYKEFLQLYDTNTFTSVFEKDLSPEQIKKALDTISVIKKKRDWPIKERTYANGKKQRLWKSKVESASLIVYTDSFFLFSIIDAYEGRATVVVDIPQAYLNVEIDKFLVLKFVDEYVNTMCRINIEYEKYVIKKDSRRILYIMLNQSLHGVYPECSIMVYLFS